MDKIQFTNILNSNGYETIIDGGLIIAVCNDKTIEEGIKHIRGLVSEYDYKSSWGIKGMSADKVRKTTPTNIEEIIKHKEVTQDTNKIAEQEVKNIEQKKEKKQKKQSNKLDSDFSQMNLFDFL